MLSVQSRTAVAGYPIGEPPSPGYHLWQWSLFRSPGKRLQITCAVTLGLIAAVADQVARSEPVSSEWWLDLPLAVLVATLVLHATGVRVSPASFDGRPVDGLDELMFGVSRGRHVDEVLESLTRQACRIIRVERAVVVLRDDSDPRLAIVVAGHGVPPDYVGSRIGIDEGMAGHVITSGDPVLVEDYSQFPKRMGHGAGEGLRAGAAVPISRDGVVLGARPLAPRLPDGDSGVRSWRRCCGSPSSAPWRSSRRGCARSSSGGSRPALRRWQPRSNARRLHGHALG